jgi:hypothetical protein
MMEEPWIVRALKAAGFPSGWGATGEEIILWENEEPQPTIAELEVILPR